MFPAPPISRFSGEETIMSLEGGNEEGAEQNQVALPGNAPTNTVTSTIPLIIVDFVCDTIWEEMNLQEGLVDFPAPLDRMRFAGPGRRGPLDSEGRRLLKNMSLVHRDWKQPAQVALRRRSGIHCQAELERFLGSSFCGKWVQELQCVMGTRFVRSIMRRYPVNLFNTLHLLFSELPYLRALYLAMDVWSWVPESTFIPSVLSFIPSGLQSLHVHLHEWTDDSLCQLFDTVSNLHDLHTLSVVGSRFNEVRQFPLLAQGSPPASLKRLLLEFRTLSRWLGPLLSWLFVPRGCYSLQELRLCQISSTYYEDENTVQGLLPILMPALPDLKVLEVRLLKVVLDLPSMFYCPQWFQSLIRRCTSLEELHANVIDVPVSVLQLPVTLQHLHVFKSFDADESTVSDDERLVEILAPLLRHRNLRSVVVSELNVGKNLTKTERLCIEAGVEYTVT